MACRCHERRQKLRAALDAARARNGEDARRQLRDAAASFREDASAALRVVARRIVPPTGLRRRGE